MNTISGSRYQVGDLVFAKVRGWSPWPATIISQESSAKYKVYFCATHQEATVKGDLIWPYKENKLVFSTKYRKRKMYQAALSQIECLEKHLVEEMKKAAGEFELIASEDKENTHSNKIDVDQTRRKEELCLRPIDKNITITTDKGFKNSLENVNIEIENENEDCVTNENDDRENDMPTESSVWCTDERLPDGWKMMWYPGGSIHNVYKSPDGSLYKSPEVLLHSLQKNVTDANVEVEQAVKKAGDSLHALNQFREFKLEVEAGNNNRSCRIYDTSKEELNFESRSHQGAQEKKIKLQSTEENIDNATYCPKYLINPYFHKQFNSKNL